MTMMNGEEHLPDLLSGSLSVSRYQDVGKRSTHRQPVYRYLEDVANENHAAPNWFRVQARKRRRTVGDCSREVGHDLSSCEHRQISLGHDIDSDVEGHRTSLPTSDIVVDKPKPPNQQIEERQDPTDAAVSSAATESNGIGIDPALCRKRNRLPRKNGLVSNGKTENAEEFGCLDCGETFQRLSQLVKHFAVHASDPVNFEDQDQPKKKLVPSTRLKSRNHKLCKRNAEPLVCFLCNRTFNLRSSLVVHLRTHSGERPFSCQFCNKRFSDYSHLKRHERIHTGSKPYACEVCGQRFNQSGTVKLHMKNVHLVGDTFAESCGVCGIRFKARSLLRHMRAFHPDECHYFCEYCSFRFHTNSGLMEHMQHKHHEFGPFECRLCPAKFFQLSTLRNHSRRIH